MDLFLDDIKYSTGVLRFSNAYRCYIKGLSFLVSFMIVDLLAVILRQFRTLYNISMDFDNNNNTQCVNLAWCDTSGILEISLLNVMMLTHDLAHQGHMTLQSRFISRGLYRRWTRICFLLLRFLVVRKAYGFTNQTRRIGEESPGICDSTSRSAGLYNWQNLSQTLWALQPWSFSCFIWQIRFRTNQFHDK